MARRTIRTKRKIARSRLPLQQQLGLDTEGRYFDLRGLFNKLNARHFGNRLRGYKVVWGRKRRERPKEYFIFGTIQEEDRVIRINPWLDQRFVPLWFLGTFCITKCCMRLCRTRCAVMGGAVCTPTNSIAANANFASTNVPDVGKRKISRVFCARRGAARRSLTLPTLSSACSSCDIRAEGRASARPGHAEACPSGAKVRHRTVSRLGASVIAPLALPLPQTAMGSLPRSF